MALENNVAVTALVVSLIALLISTSQLLQQIFGTAEGYRRCLPSVVGQWSKTRHRVFHLRELRLETRFQTPEFALVEEEAANSKPVTTAPSSLLHLAPEKTSEKCPDFINGSDDSRKRTLTKKEEDDHKRPSRWDQARFFLSATLIWTDENVSSVDTNSIPVGWLSFLEKLHDHEQIYERQIAFIRTAQPVSKGPILSQQSYFRRARPAVKRVERSWDFMPVDALRPLASIQLGDLLVLCYRLRILWRDLRLGDKFLRAEGRGHSFSSIDIRGLGFVVEYRYAKNNAPEVDPPANLHFIPSREADKLAFGLIPICSGLGISEEHFDLGGEDYLSSIMEMHRKLGVGSRTIDYFKRKRDQNPDELYHLSNEVLFMVAPFLPATDLGITKIQFPFRHRFGSLITFREGRIILLHLIEEYTAKLDIVPSRLQIFKEVLGTLAENFKEEFYRDEYFNLHLFDKNATDRKAFEWLEYIRSEFDDTTQYFARGRNPVNFRDLVASHLEVGLVAHQEARAKKPEKARNGTGLAELEPWKAELVYLYVDKLEEIWTSMQQKHKSRARTKELQRTEELSLEVVREAWWTLMLRAILWDVSTYRISNPGLPLRSSLYGDSTLIWIT